MPARPPSRGSGRADGVPAVRRLRRPVTGRALVLGAVVVLLVVILAAPLHRFLAARSAVTQSEAQRNAGQKDLKALQALDKQLSDPAYIADQARSRLQYAMPGDTVYQVVQPGQQSSIDTTSQQSTNTTTIAGDTWNQRLWGSITGADHSP
jgi:cell division protein FtsB